MAELSYIKKISGLSQKITPEEGKSTIGGATIHLVDVDGGVTQMIAGDTDHWHRKRVVLDLGYYGIPESSFLRVFTGWITGLKLSSDGGVYEITATDPQKWMQRKVFRRASQDSPTEIQGNPINILLAVLTSTGAGTNGAYDWFGSEEGLGISTDYIDVAGIEAVRDSYYPGQSHQMRFSITGPEKASDWLQREILKVLNIYPSMDGQGRYGLTPFRPATLTGGSYGQDLGPDTIIGTPSWDANLSAMINEIEFHYDWDGEKFQNVRYEINTDSINARGPAAQPLVIKSKGLHSDFVDVDTILDRRTETVFNRYAVPPAKVKVECFMSRALTEAGDYVNLTHPLLPDFDTGTRGLVDRRMEVVSRTPDWTRGRVSFELLDVGAQVAGAGDYVAISPVMTITAAASGTAFTVSTADATSFTAGASPVVDIFDAKMRLVAANVTINTIDTGTGAVACSDMGTTPPVGGKVVFADYDNATATQRNYAYMADAGGTLGTASDDAQAISP